MADLSVRLTPRASADRLGPVGPDGVLRARVTAPPVDGRANDALCRLLAKRLGVAPSRVSVVRGLTGRDKVVRVEGLEAAEVLGRLGE